MKTIRLGDVAVANHLPFVLIAGPCQIESRAHALEVAHGLAEITRAAGVKLIYKSSFDKANRTSATAARGVGMAQGLQILATVREQIGLPVLTDVHLPEQCAAGGRGGGRAANPRVFMPPNRPAARRRRDRPRDQREEGPVPRALGHGECGRQDRGYRERKHPALRTRRQLRLQHAGHGFPLPADHGPHRLSRWCSTRPIPCSSLVGRAPRPAASASSRRCWRAPRWRWVSRRYSSRPTPIRTTRQATGRT